MTELKFSSHTRQGYVNKLGLQADALKKPEVFDAVIVGGGIVGAGLARELAIRGIKPLLVEKNDFASGTSSKSSKLIHGGLRYLEMLDFHLVFESLSERHWLLQTHPHLVQPLEFDIPIYAKKDAPPGARANFLLGIALWLYDGLSLFRTPFFHGKHSAGEVGSLFPQIRKNGLRGSYYYADAMMLDDELVLETLLDAHRRGALPLNYVKADHVSERGADGLFEVKLHDTLNEGQPFSVKAREVIVCVGPWTEKIDSLISKGSGRKLKPSKGIHLVIPWKRLPIERCLVMYAGDGRIVFAIPRKDLGTGAEMLIVGTTDAPEHGDLERIHANLRDVEYLLTVLKEYFPEAKIGPSDIVSTFAGVRPLIDDGSESEAKTSREHEIWRNEAGIVFMAGGKYTTFRRISQEIADFAFPKSRKNEVESKAPLSTAQDYAARLEGTPVWGRFTDQWIRWKLENHAPCTLEDVVSRRLPVWMAGADQLENGLLDEIAALCQSHFRWSPEQVVEQKARAIERLRLNSLWSEEPSSAVQRI